MDPACIRIVPMRHRHDCVVCCLAMLLDISYDAALLAVSKVRPDGPGASGLYWTDAKRAAKQLNHNLRVHRGRKDWDNLTGILACEPLPGSEETVTHAVLVLRGLVIDPFHGEVWDDLDTYLTANKYKATSLLVRKD